jgi:hypothetical protein
MDTHRETKVGIEPPAGKDKSLHLEGQAVGPEKTGAGAAPEVQELPT